MDYSKILHRAWDIIWRHKFLIILGVLVALGSSLGSSTSGGTNLQFTGDTANTEFGVPLPESLSGTGMWDSPVLPIWLLLFLAGMGVIVALVLWVVSALARGGLIAGAAAGDSGRSTSFSQAWSAGWKRGWTLLGIGVLPAIPGLVLLLMGGMGFWVYMSDASTRLGIPAVRNVAVILAMLACLAVPLVLVLELLRALANRACMLEGLGVLDAYRRGIQVLIDNLGSALVLFLIQVAVTLVMFILLIVPGICLALCCLFWPVLVLLQGAVTAYFSTMWTVAWREWTGAARADESLAA
ncbi:MAG: hypothetical protein PVI09_13645 [Anaerolineae bacterium]|jgi:hypothetical protein